MPVPPLYPPQVPWMDNLRQAFDGLIWPDGSGPPRPVRSVIGQAPTGFGKGTVGAKIIDGGLQHDQDIWFVVHRKQLVDQFHARFKEYGIRHGFIAAGWPENENARLHICSVASLVRRLDNLKPPHILICDEGHHCCSDTYLGLFQWYWETPVQYARGVILLTATPQRLDGKGLAQVADTIVEGPQIKWLQDNGYLVPAKVYAPPTDLDLSAVRKSGADYNQEDLSVAVDKSTITGCAVKHYQQITPEQQAVVYCVDRKHKEKTVEAFKKAGVACAGIDGLTPDGERRSIVTAFSNKSIQVLVNVELLTEGFDCPGIEVVIHLRPTKSLGLYMQMNGRGLRTDRGKTECVILDHVGNVFRHGLPWADRVWSLDGRVTRREQERMTASRRCPECYFVFESGSVCPDCGYEIPVNAREIKFLPNGQLQLITDDKKVDEEIARRARAAEVQKRLKECKTLADVQKLGADMDYKPGWALVQWNMKQAKWSRYARGGKR